MFRNTKIFLKSFPLYVIVWKIKCKIFKIKIPELNKWQQYFKNKKGLEIGGPSGIFNVSGFLPIYNIANSIDGVNFSNKTVWEGNLAEGENYKYNNKIGYQYISEGNNLSKIKSEAYDFVLSCNNLEHIANPIKAILEWKRILKNSGVLLLVLPNKEANFDHKRPYTTIEHLMSDYNNNIDEKDMTHLNEILQLHNLKRDPQSKSYENFVKRSNLNFENRCLHHHVFNQNLLKEIASFCNLKVLKQYTTYTDHFILLQKL